MKISVAMAVFRGERFIEEQLNSILPQLGQDDEIVIFDDLPGGETQRIIERTALKDSRVKYFEGCQKGVVKNFENCIAACSGDIIFLADQDDVWLPQKVAAATIALNAGADLVLHDAKVCNAGLEVLEESFFSVHKSAPGLFRNLLRNSYVGCCMAFRSELREAILPFPEKIAMHDWWIGLVAEKSFTVDFIERPLILYRRHEDTATGRERITFIQRLKWRAIMLFCLLQFGKKYGKN